MPRPLTVEAISETVVDRHKRPRGRGDPARRAGRPPERARHHRAQRHSPKYLAESDGFGFTGRVERDVELSPEHASSHT